MPQNPPVLSLRASGPLACFTRPEFAERISYPWISPWAARALFEAVLWKPRIRFEIREIQVLNPILFGSIRRNEVSGKIPTSGLGPQSGLLTDQHRQQRNTTALTNVAYLIRAELFLNDEVPASGADDNHGKYRDCFSRRLDKGQHFHQPYLGAREFAADLEPERGDEVPIAEDLDHGLMFYDYLYPTTPAKHRQWRKGAKPKPLFYPSVMRAGVVAVPPRDQVLAAQPTDRPGGDA